MRCAVTTWDRNFWCAEASPRTIALSVYIAHPDIDEPLHSRPQELRLTTLENRLPRESFSKALARMCKKLDEAPERLVLEKPAFSGNFEARITITSLWVVGSYARGAEHCGDLDVVIDWRSRNGLTPSTQAVKNIFFGPVPRLQCFSGTPKNNSSYVAFPDAVKIWSGPGCNWENAIESIKVVQGAGRQARETDLIPLRPCQMNCCWDGLHNVVEQLKSGILEQDFVAFTPEMIAADVGADLDPTARYLFSLQSKKSQALMPPIVRLMDKIEPNLTWYYEGGTSLRCGGSMIRLGLPSIDLHLLKPDTGVRQLVIIPHLSARGPNGAWILRRGPNHPDAQTFGQRQAYALTCGGKPVVQANYQVDSMPHSICLLELYKSESAAQRKRGTTAKTQVEEVAISPMQGQVLLNFIIGVDAVKIGRTIHALSPRATGALRKPISTIFSTVA